MNVGNTETFCLSNEAYFVLYAANACAYNLQMNNIQPEHLLWGEILIARACKNPITKVFEARGFDDIDVRNETMKIRNILSCRDTKENKSEDFITFSNSSVQILKSAKDTATYFGYNTIQLEHIFSSILKYSYSHQGTCVEQIVSNYFEPVKVKFRKEEGVNDVLEGEGFIGITIDEAKTISDEFTIMKLNLKTLKTKIIRNEDKAEDKHSIIGLVFSKIKSYLQREKTRKILKNVILLTFLVLAIYNVKEFYKFKKIYQQIIINKPSHIFTQNKEMIATIGNERNGRNNMLSNAVIAIEDERYYSRKSAIDLKRTGGVTLMYLTGRNGGGGSTIQQQVIKNIENLEQEYKNDGKEAEYKRTPLTKVHEMQHAIFLDIISPSRSELLELYLDIIYLGGEGGISIYGVEEAANYYFDKKVPELTIEECAFIAGIIHSPSKYNPYTVKNFDEIKVRTKTVLGKMKQLGYINDSEYSNAINGVENGLKFKKGYIEKNDDMDWHTKNVVQQVKEEIMAKYKVNGSQARFVMEHGGLTIYSSQNLKIQKTLDKEYSKGKYIVKSGDGVYLQSASVAIDGNGYVVATVGGIGKTQYNRVYATRQPGSTIKLATLAAGFEQGKFNANTVFNDVYTKFDNNYGDKNADKIYAPTNAYNIYRGKINVKKACAVSSNVVFTKLLELIGPDEFRNILVNMGITTLAPEDNNLVIGIRSD